MSRYWNGHQWKDLPTERIVADAMPDETVVDAPTDSTPSAAAAAAPAPAPASATIVPTHAEYGDVFVAASAAAEAGEPAR